MRPHGRSRKVLVEIIGICARCGTSPSILMARTSGKDIFERIILLLLGIIGALLEFAFIGAGGYFLRTTPALDVVNIRARHRPSGGLPGTAKRARPSGSRSWASCMRGLGRHRLLDHDRRNGERPRLHGLQHGRRLAVPHRRRGHVHRGLHGGRERAHDRHARPQPQSCIKEACRTRNVCERPAFLTQMRVFPCRSREG